MNPALKAAGTEGGLTGSFIKLEGTDGFPGESADILPVVELVKYKITPAAARPEIRCVILEIIMVP